MVVAVLTAVAAFAPRARADTPTCTEVFDDPTIPTCTCICDAGSQFPGCFNAAAGAKVPTPNQCPDILQGRRVIARDDALIVDNPVGVSADTYDIRVRTFGAMNDPNNPGLGYIVGDPLAALDPATVPCGDGTVRPYPQVTRAARLYDSPTDWFVNIQGGIDVSCETFVTRQIFDGDGNARSGRIRTGGSGMGAWTKVAVADFDRDGFDDLFVIGTRAAEVFGGRGGPPPSSGASLERGPYTDVDRDRTMVAINDPAVGDFNGDGLLDVAWIGGAMNVDGSGFGTGSLSVFFATVCPGSVPGNPLCEGAERFEMVVNPATKLFPSVPGATSTIVLDDATLANVDCTRETKGRLGALAMGNFEDNGNGPTGAPIDELMVGYVLGSSFPSDRKGCWLRVQYFTFADPATTPDKSWAASRAKNDRVLAPADRQTTTQLLYGQAARLDWFGVTEQAVFAIGNTFDNSAGRKTGSNWPLTVSVSATGNQTSLVACLGPSFQVTPPMSSFGSAVGTFSTSAEIDPPTACGTFSEDYEPGQCPFNPQIALLIATTTDFTSGLPADSFLPLWNVRPSKPGGSTTTLQCNNDPSIQTNYMTERYIFTRPDRGVVQPMTVAKARYAGNRLAVGDLLGASTRLGDPTITRISNHTQPQIIIQTPPSLVDYVQPNGQDSETPAIVNFTRAPGNFNAKVNFDTSSMQTASTRETTSFTASASQTVAGEIKFKVPLVSQISVKNKTSWGQLEEENTSKQLGGYSMSRLQTGGAIGVDDQVWWTQTTFNVFNYPVIDQTVCPAQLSCDLSDPPNIDCDAPVTDESVVLTCTATSAPPGCQCLSDGASASLCPTTATCNEDGGNICCSQPPEQLVMSVSGPEEVIRSSTPGANIEWYHPKHEPGQILSYPSSRALLQAREPNAQPLGNLTSFSTGTNDTSETLSWSCGTSGDFSVGTTTRHSFATASTITAGTNKIAKEAFGGGSLSVGFDYQDSDSLATLNSYTVGQTASSNITVNLEGAGFLNTPQYAYSVQGVVLGGVEPESVLDAPPLGVCPSDNTNCTAAQEVPADCTTTGPLNVAFAANPTSAGNGVWWQAGSPYSQHIDVALNNPSRWNRVTASQVADPTLQCRGPATTPFCYTTNQPPAGTTASDAWSSLFYSMKGLLVTNGGTAGPQRDTATVGDQVFLQLRVSNYSLRTMDPGTRVLARIYRQQLDVDNNNGPITGVQYATDANGNPLPAVPIGPNGLGDTDPIPVVSPQDGSATIPPFNTTSSPANDNISVATTSYSVAEDDACEYDNGVQVCNGAYYAYWVTVWAEDAAGNVLSELPGHGLGAAFDPDKIYEFITDVPLEGVTFDGKGTTFSNNVAMYKKVFAILPVSSGAVAAAPPGELALDLLNVSAEKTVLGEPVVVSAQVVSLGAATPGATVVFSDGDPLNGGTVFDAEWLPHIRADDAHFVRVNYNPETCGAHEIFVEVTGGPRALGAEQIAVVDVGIDYNSAIRFLIEEVWDLHLAVRKKADLRKKFDLIRKLRSAEHALDADRTENGVYLLHKFNDDVEVLKRRGRIIPEKADALTAQSNQIAGCVW
jgi:hypothetical protein